MPERLATKLLIVGWDAADWKLIDALLAMERMPTLRRLIDRGVRGELRSLDPMLSPLLWTSIATGKTADKHGVLHFIEPDATGKGLRPSSSTTRRGKALWNILTQAGLRTAALGWYASHPAEPIRGVSVSNLFYEGMPGSPAAPWPLTPGTVHPAALAGEVESLRLHPGEIQPGELLSLVPDLAKASRDDRRVDILVKHVAQSASVHNIATTLLSDPDKAGGPLDCAMVFHELIDVVGHHFMQYHPPRMPHVGEADFALYRHVMFGVYQLMDMMLGAMLELAGPETTVILLSDHGFHSDHLRPPVPPALDDEHAAMDATWHRPMGVLVMSGPGVKAGEAVHGATVLDITPTALALLGQPVGADMDGRVLAEALARPVAVEKVFSWDTLEGEAGLHPEGLRVDPFDAQQTMKQLADLGYIQDVPTNVQRVMDKLRAETAFNLGVVHLSARRYDKALEHFQALAGEHPGEPRYVMNLAHCQQQLGHWDRAATTLRELVAAHPELPDAQLMLASAELAGGKPAEAMATLERIEGRLADHPDRLTMIGGIALISRDVDKAESAFRRLAALDPDEPRAHHGLAEVAIRRERYEDAIEHALRAVELRHVFPEAYYSLGVALTWSKDYPRAIQSFNVCVSMQPGHIDAHRYLASIHRHLGDRKNAYHHRCQAEDLIQRRDRHQVFQQGFLQDAPAGPLEWARSAGVPDDPNP